jgi:hypothetical protein
LTSSLSASGVHQLNMKELERIRLEFHAVVKAVSDHAAGGNVQVHVAQPRKNELAAASIASAVPVTSTQATTAPKPGPSINATAASSSINSADNSTDSISRFICDTVERVLSSRFSPQSTLPSSVAAGQLSANFNPASAVPPQAGTGLMQYVPAGWYPVPATGRQ